MKNSKRIKGFAVGCLAVLMCGTVLLGVGCTPATSGAQGARPTSSADGGANNPAGINTSPFGLDPANDPVVYTTAGGLEIKCSNALTNTNLASYTYFTMGSYDGTPVNWVIIGYDSSLQGSVGDYPGDSEIKPVDRIENGFTFAPTVDDSPMGNAIKAEMFLISNSAVKNDEIGDGCVLCYSEDLLYRAQFSSSNSTGNYEESDLKDSFNSLCNDSGGTLNFTQDEKKLIQKQTIKNIYLANSESETADQYLFPLAGRGENFTISNYLNEQQRAGASFWYWLRSGYEESNQFAHCVDEVGIMYPGGHANSSNGVRPAFVMKLG